MKRYQQCERKLRAQKTRRTGALKIKSEIKAPKRSRKGSGQTRERVSTERKGEGRRGVGRGGVGRGAYTGEMMQDEIRVLRFS
jgi:hypothetical protein